MQHSAFLRRAASLVNRRRPSDKTDRQDTSITMGLGLSYSTLGKRNRPEQKGEHNHGKNSDAP